MNWIGFRGLAISAAATLLLLSPAGAQQQGQSGSGSNNNTRPNNPAPPVRPPTSQRPPRQNPQIIFITGTVVQGDGSPIPLGTTIERNCNGRIKREATVNSSGYFSFQVGGDNVVSGVLPEASDDTFGGGDVFGSRSRQNSPFATGAMNNSSTPNLAGCELRARAPGYRSSTLMLDGILGFGQMNVGTIVIQPLEKVPGTLVSATSLRAPKKAKKALEKAQKELRKKNMGKAESQLETALGIYPDYAEAWSTLGQLYAQQGQTAKARTAFEKALSIDKMYVTPYVQLARLAGLEQKWPEVAKLTDLALTLDPLDFPEGYFFNSMAYYSLNKMDVAEKSARKALRLDPMHHIPQVYLVLADILHHNRDLAGSAEQLRLYLKYAPDSPSAGKVKARLEELESSSAVLTGKP